MASLPWRVRAELGDPGRRNMIPGVLDAGISSLATFAVGVFAVQSLEPTIVGGYALAFAAFAMAGVMPDVAVFTPLEVLAVEHPPKARLRLIRHTLRIGVPSAVIFAFAVSLWTLVAPAALPRDAVVAFTVTATVCAFLSPIQDHVRRMLHSAGMSWLAVIVSAVQVVVVIAAIFLFGHLGLAIWWAPFGILALANLLSLATGIGLAHRHATPNPVSVRWRWSDVARSGRWMLLVGLIPTGTTFIVAALVSHLAGPAILGYAEATRLAAQPLLVLTLGLSATLRPGIIAAARFRDAAGARSATRRFAFVIFAAAVSYAAIAGHVWSGNPLAWLVPNAYAIPGLALAMMASVTMQALALPGRFQMMGASRERGLALIEITANVVRSGVGATAGLLGAFAIPAGNLLLCLTRFLAQRRMLRDYYTAGRLDSRTTSHPPSLRSVQPPTADVVKSI